MILSKHDRAEQGGIPRQILLSISRSLEFYKTQTMKGRIYFPLSSLHSISAPNITQCLFCAENPKCRREKWVPHRRANLICYVSILKLTISLLIHNRKLFENCTSKHYYFFHMPVSVWEKKSLKKGEIYYSIK